MVKVMHCNGTPRYTCTLCQNVVIANVLVDFMSPFKSGVTGLVKADLATPRPFAVWHLKSQQM